MFWPFTFSTATSVVSKPVRFRICAGIALGNTIWLLMPTAGYAVISGVIVKSQAEPL